jgi:hypothetical protein
MQTSDLIAAGALLVSIAALWRTEWSRASDLRTSVLRDQAAVRMALDVLAEKIPLGLQSRRRVAAMTGQAGNLMRFEGEATADIAELERLRTRLALTMSSRIRDAAIAVHELETRVEQLRAKYAAAWAEDDVQRQRRYEEMVARVNRARGGPGA